AHGPTAANWRFVARKRAPTLARMRAWIAKSLCLLVLVACAPLAHAHIYRCIGAHGEPVFSGQPCANPVPANGSNAAAPDQGSGSVCAGSPQELKVAIAQAFAAHDANRMAGLLLWRGMGEASARTMLRSLAAWLKQPLAGIAVARATGPPPLVSDPRPASSSGHFIVSTATLDRPTAFVVSTGGGDGSTRDFGITEIGGCWWLTF
ncbi:MAG: DUF4124 domain-containing protein, partial [Rhodanobacteraceae bacterium]